jgi:hypothetical protein
MSVGNLKDQGNQGKNFPYQLNSLKLLGEIVGSSAAVEALLLQIYNEIKDDNDDEYTMYLDPIALVWYMGKWATDDGGNPTVLYYLTDGTGPVTPANPVEPVKGKIHITSSNRWEAMVDQGADNEWELGDIIEERFLTFYSQTGSMVPLIRHYYSVSRGFTAGAFPTFTSYGGLLPRELFKSVGARTWVPTESLGYVLGTANAIYSPGVEDGWVSTFGANRAIVEVVTTSGGGKQIRYSLSGPFTGATAANQKLLEEGDVLELTNSLQLERFYWEDKASLNNVTVNVTLFY